MGSALIGRARRRAPEPGSPMVKSTSMGSAQRESGTLAHRHLVFHIWPSLQSDSWKWNIRQLLDRIDLFTGVRSIAVVTGPGTASLSDVQAEFAGIRIDHWINQPNDPQRGEGVTFPLLLQTLPRHGVTFYGHAKGSSYAAEQDRFTSVRLWARVLYRVNLDAWPAVAQQLAAYPITGAFKRLTTFPAPVGTANWHYSGTFFWFRNADVLASPNRQTLAENKYGVELWSGSQFPADRMGETFGGDGPNLYASMEAAKWDLAADDWIRSLPASQPPAPKVHTIHQSPGVRQPWRGTIAKKPWEYDLTMIIPTWDPHPSFELVLELLRLQSIKPYILLIDNGSQPESLAWLDTLRAPDLELHSLRLNAVHHSSEPVSMACDVGTALAQTRFVAFTHTDCFLRSRTALEELRDLAAVHKTAGHRLSPRPYQGWEQEYGHTLLVVDQDDLDQTNARWKMRCLMTDGIVPADYNVNPETPNVPDTENLFNRRLAQHGFSRQFTGTEENYQRNTDRLIDHVRSHASSKHYSPGYHATANEWLVSAIEEARQRIQEWTELNRA